MAKFVGCSVEGCNNDTKGRKLCPKHRYRFYKHGDPTVTSNERHGEHSTYLYRVWSGMRARCSNPKHMAYKNYGGRGITVCKEWESFTVFKQDVGDRPTARHTLDRIDNNKGYSKDNCRWATRTEQSWNKRYKLPSTGEACIYKDGNSFQLNYRGHRIGSFQDIEVAALFRDAGLWRVAS